MPRVIKQMPSEEATARARHWVLDQVRGMPGVLGVDEDRYEADGSLVVYVTSLSCPAAQMVADMRGTLVRECLASQLKVHVRPVPDESARLDFSSGSNFLTPAALIAGKY